MNFERIFKAALNSKPSDEQLEQQAKYYPEHKLTSALTGWNGRTLNVDNISIANEYGEPGYTNPKRAVLFADWNQVSRRIQDLLERAGYACEWYDEWVVCDCGKAIRTSADSYSWQPSYIADDNGIQCLECAKNNAEDYLKSLCNNPRRALNVKDVIDPADYGYTLVKDDLEAGFNGGDDPRTVYTELRKQDAYKDKDILFVVSSSGQFDVSYQVWIKGEHNENT